MRRISSRKPGCPRFSATRATNLRPISASEVGNEEMADPRAISHNPLPSRASPTVGSRTASKSSGMRRRSRNAMRSRARNANAHNTKMGSESATRYGARSAPGTEEMAAVKRAVRPGMARSARASGRKSTPPSSASATGSRKTPNEHASSRIAVRSPARSRYSASQPAPSQKPPSP